MLKYLLCLACSPYRNPDSYRDATSKMDFALIDNFRHQGFHHHAAIQTILDSFHYRPGTISQLAGIRKSNNTWPQPELLKNENGLSKIYRVKIELK